MYISKLTLQNFKGFKGIHELIFDEGINFFVGDNNCGKSTIFEAIDFITSKRKKEEVVTKGSESCVVSVEIELKGDDIEKILEGDALKKYQNYLIDINGEKSLRISRSSEENEILQAGKQKRLDIGNVRVFNPNEEQFENPTGVDNTVGALFDAQFIWADTDSDDVANFQKTKICGKIINAIVSDNISESWEEFKNSHEKTFKEISKNLEPIEKQIQTKLSEQYGDAEVKFMFTLPELADFLKSGNINLSDSGIETTSSEKGTGMQRALALSLIQVYADISSIKVEKPILFFIDEPETFLHPRAQNKLLDALEKISEKSQIFIITHSPYLLKKYNRGNHSMNIFSKDDGFNKVSGGKFFDLFGTSSPTWGEINYYAFEVISVEFHNELYGFIQAKATMVDEKYYGESYFDSYLSDNGIDQDKGYIRLNKDKSTKKYQTTLPTYIRNIIHHPENTHNIFSEEEMRRSIEMLIPLMK